MARQVPIVAYLVLEEGNPHLLANECEDCAALFFDRRNACAKCGGEQFGKRRLGTTGTLRAFTIVHRAAAGVPVPYASVVVDLDGGGMVKANYLGGEPDPKQIKLGMPVRLDTCVVGTDDAGTEAIAFGFVAD